MRKRLILRVAIIAALLTGVVLILLWRLYSLQILSGEKFRLAAESQYVSALADTYDRGTIFMLDNSGSKMSVGTVRPLYTLAIDPRNIGTPTEIYKKLMQVEGIAELLNEEDFLRKAGKTNDPYEEILKGLPKGVAREIQALELDGVLTIAKRKRYYPGDSFASHVLGVVAFDEQNHKVGRYGIEKYYEDVLVRDSSSLYVNFFAELFADVKGAVSKDAHREGDVILTIDPEVQVFVESEMKALKKEWDSAMTAAIVMNPHTGEILAMAVTPTFDPNDLASSGMVSFANPLISGLYEMGSIIKVLTMAVGIDTGKIEKETTYYDEGSLTFGDDTIHNYDGVGRGWVPMQEILSQSLNTGVAFIAKEVGKTQMREYFLDKFLLSEETGVDLPAELAGNTKNISSNRDLEFATASFGQGIALTPVATIRALSAIANGGYMVQPHMVKRIEYTSKLAKTYDYSDQKVRVLDYKTTEVLSQMLTHVVDEVLAGGEAKMPHHSLSAKTGTAQIAVRGGYSEDKYLHTFFGYGPSYNAEFAILLMNLEPKGARYASETLTKPFVNISKFLINDLNIAPDR